jgi:hypothetical protein
MMRKNLSADGMISILKKSFSLISEHRKKGVDGVEYSISDSLLTAFGAFSLKYDSFNLFFKDLDACKIKRANVQSLYQVNKVPSTTRLKEIIDPIETSSLRPAFNDIFRELQRGGALKNYLYLDKYYILALDGTQYYTSDNVFCDCCLVKESSTGKKSYSHQMLAACIVHPGLKQVIPVAPEPIQNCDGHTKNDCERNAAKRFLIAFRSDHPKLPVIVTEDGLSSNGPHIKELKGHNMSFVLGVKPGDHKYLFDWINAYDESEIGFVQNTNYDGTKVIYRTTQKIRFINEVPLNASNDDLLVNFLEVVETVEKKVERYVHDPLTGLLLETITEWIADAKPTTFTWVTDIKISKDNAFPLMLAGRRRWAIENETFNTLKNQGYSFEHNYGHGNKNLATNFSFLMMMAFLIDQVQEMCCSLFTKVLTKIGRKKYLWEKMRVYFMSFKISANWEGFWNFILEPEKFFNFITT